MSVELPGDPASLRAVSALSTGGAGTIFEYQVAAVALVALLRGDSVPVSPAPLTR